jgi:hypothetical protein
MNHLRSLAICLVSLMLATSCAGQATNTTSETDDASDKYLIDLSGFNLPYVENLLASIPAMQERGYAGSVFKLEGLWSDVFNSEEDHRYDQATFEANYDNLRQLKESGYTENFLMIYSQAGEGWSWLSDEDWKLTEDKLRGFAKAGKEGNVRGFLFDTEPYGFSPWRYDQEYYQGQTLEQVSQVVRERGKRFIDIIQTEMPNAEILMLWLMYPILEEWENYTMIKPFFEGMLEAALPTITFIDGNEKTYYFTKKEEFEGSKVGLQEAHTALDPSLTDKYKQQFKTATSLFVDGLMNTWTSPRFFGYYLANDEERLGLIQHNVYHALRTTDRYVWIYNENMNYYDNQVLPGLVEQLQLASNKISSGQELGFDVAPFVDKAKLEFDRKINVSGTVTTTETSRAGAAKINSGYTSPKGEESACIVFDAYGNYSCTFPYGETVTLTPTLEGAEFTPDKLVLENLTSPLGGQNFTEQ